MKTYTLTGNFQHLEPGDILWVWDREGHYDDVVIVRTMDSGAIVARARWWHKIRWFFVRILRYACR